MNTNEIHDMIQQASTEPTQETISRILVILDEMNTNIARADSTACRAANTASCLANGIIPD